MRRLIFMLVILFMVYFGIQFGFKYFGNGHDIQYEIISGDIEFQVSENFKMRYENEQDNYYFQINKDDFQVSFQTYYNFRKYDMVITDIKYYQDQKYECVLPIFRDNLILFDMMCVDQSKVVSYYHNLKGTDESLDQYVSTLKDIGYDISQWSDSLEGAASSKEFITVYHDNIVDGHYVAINNYKGLYTISNDDKKKVFEVELFEEDTYERPVSTQVGRYYLTADYDMDHEFTNFILIDLMYNGEQTIQYHSKISFNSYFMGVVDQSAYLYDRENKKQYEVDIEHKKIVEVGNEKVGIQFYQNGTWERINISELANQDLYFDTTDLVDVDTTGYARVDKVGGKLSGYYYFYRLRDNGYDVYRADVMNPSLLTYLFHTSNISSVKYISDYVYFVEGATVKYYQDQVGIRTLFTNTELVFNQGIVYYVYEK